jgi:hypothetical protein
VLFLRALPRNPEMRLFSFDVKTARARELVTAAAEGPQRVVHGESTGIVSCMRPARRARRGGVVEDLDRRDTTQTTFSTPNHRRAIRSCA